jgi:hypothetical protein
MTYSPQNPGKVCGTIIFINNLPDMVVNIYETLPGRGGISESGLAKKSWDSGDMTDPDYCVWPGSKQ